MESKYLKLTKWQRSQRRAQGKSNFLYVRYCDDFVVFGTGSVSCNSLFVLHLCPLPLVNFFPPGIWVKDFHCFRLLQKRRFVVVRCVTQRECSKVVQANSQRCQSGFCKSTPGLAFLNLDKGHLGPRQSNSSCGQAGENLAGEISSGCVPLAWAMWPWATRNAECMRAAA